MADAQNIMVIRELIPQQENKLGDYSVQQSAWMTRDVSTETYIHFTENVQWTFNSIQLQNINVSRSENMNKKSQMISYILF